MFLYYIQEKTVKDLTRYLMSFYSKMLLIVQFLEVKNNTSMYIIHSQKTVN